MDTQSITGDIYDYTDSSGRTQMALVREEGGVRIVRFLQENGSSSEPVPASDLPGTLVGPLGFYMEGERDLIVPPVDEKRWVLVPPIVYRYMPQRFIDEFFTTGRLMLSSFATFKRHVDEERGDPKEGRNVITAIGENLSVFMGTQHGTHSLILSTSVRGDENLMRQFGCDGYFRIVDTHLFGRAIGECLAGYTDGLEGFCSYRDQHLLRKKIPASVAAKSKMNPQNESDLEEAILHISGIGGVEVFFSKRREYEHQAEYRMVWNLSHAVDEALIVECPEAVRYCEKVT